MYRYGSCGMVVSSASVSCSNLVAAFVHEISLVAVEVRKTDR